jgi:tetratricopeptide (TPR) repeat protein
MWFNNAWMQMWGYNHEEAIRLFEKALKADPTFAMAHAGIAMSNGPNYNNPGGFSAEAAHDHIVQAQRHSTRGSAEEKAVIAALAVRFVKTGNTSSFNTPGFATAMRGVYKTHGQDVGIAALFAESLMNLHPWTLWKKNAQGETVPTAPETTELVTVLEKGLHKQHDYPPLCHLYIHTMELSDEPWKALPHANHLRTSVPDQGHLRHMPSHIDMWVGQYKEAVDSNVLGIIADEKYVTTEGHDREFYKMYRLHNYQFVIWAAMFDGQWETAKNYSQRLQARISNDDVNFMVAGTIPMGAVYFESYGYTPFQAMMRFGKWKEILAEPLPNPKSFVATYASALLHRAIAYAATGKVADAEKEKTKFETAAAVDPLAMRNLHMNKMWDASKIGVQNMGILNVGYHVLQGLIAHAKGNAVQAEKFLRQAVDIEQKLAYDEPWGWMTPSRHTLGQVLLENRKFMEAEKVFREDLKIYMNNLWALNGLHKALVGQGKTKKAKLVARDFEKARGRLDVDIDVASRLKA